MTTSTYYASIAIVEVHPDNTVTIESISVTEGECVLSGAWDFNISESEKISNVLSGKMIIPIGEKKNLEKLPIKGEIVVLDSVPFWLMRKRQQKKLWKRMNLLNQKIWQKERN